MRVLVGTHERYFEHSAGAGHPERPERLAAVLEGVTGSPARDAAVYFSPRAATVAELATVHTRPHVDAVHDLCAAGGGSIDMDTAVVRDSWDASLLAAGAGLDAIARLDAGEGDAAFLAVRPPGHHATRAESMGFCLFNNVAVAARALADRGERVAIIDWDAHHGNGTQDVFYEDPRVLYVSIHQYPLYPGTGWIDETGAGEGAGTTINLPLPPACQGDVFRAALDEVVMPEAERFAPTWLIISAGFDGHREDPMADLRLSAGDYVDLTARVAKLVPSGRTIAFLEGGYNLHALTASTTAAFSALAGEVVRPEPVTFGTERGFEIVAAVREQLRRRAVG